MKTLVQAAFLTMFMLPLEAALAAPIMVHHNEQSSILNLPTKPHIACLHRDGSNILGTLKVISTDPFEALLRRARPRALTAKFRKKLERLIRAKRTLRANTFSKRRQKLKSSIREIRAFAKQCKTFNPSQSPLPGGGSGGSGVSPHSNGPGSIDPTFGEEGTARVASAFTSWFSNGAYSLLGLDSESENGEFIITLNRQPENLQVQTTIQLPTGDVFQDSLRRRLSDGSLLLAGTLYHSVTPQTLNRSDAAIVMIRPDGTLDTRFGSNGWVVIDLHATVLNRFVGSPGFIPAAFTSSDALIELHVFEQPGGNGYVTAFGSISSSEGPLDFAARLNLDGSPVQSINQGAPFLLAASVHAEGIQLPDGSNVVIGRLHGRVPPAGRETIPLFKLSPAGTIDLSFGNAGQLFVELPAGTKYVYKTAASLTPDNRILMAVELSGAINAEDIFLTKIAADGSVDTSFGDQGMALFDLNAREKLGGFLVTERSEIAIGITHRDAGPYKGLLLLLDSTGNSITTFGDGGVATIFESPKIVTGTQFTGLFAMPQRQIAALGKEDGKSVMRLVNLE